MTYTLIITIMAILLVGLVTYAAMMTWLVDSLLSRAAYRDLKRSGAFD